LLFVFLLSGVMNNSKFSLIIELMCQVFQPPLSFSLQFLQTTLLNPHDTSDKRPKLERARSAAEKENHPLQRTGSQLRRQYSQQETSTRRASASESGVEDNYLQRSHLHSQPGIGGGGSNFDGQYMNQSPQYRNTSGYYQGSTGGYPQENDPRHYKVRMVASVSLSQFSTQLFFLLCRVKSKI
jgi:hypothetical protein